MSSKVCDDCGIDTPLDAMHFDRDRASADGFKDTCKMCRKEQREASLKPSKAPGEVQRDIEDQAIAMLENLSPNKQGISVPHMAELFEAVIEAFQGPQGLARHILSTFVAAKPGGPVRQKILADIIRLGMKTTETGMAQVALDKLTTEELEELHKTRLAEIAKGKSYRPPTMTVIEQIIEEEHLDGED